MNTCRIPSALLCLPLIFAVVCREAGFAQQAVPGVVDEMGVPVDDSFEFSVYGFAKLDYIQDFNRVDPDWAVALRPSRIPTEAGEFGEDGQSVLSVRQSLLGVRTLLPTSVGNVRTVLEIDFFGVGFDQGQTAPRLRKAYGDWGPWRAGQSNSLFTDIDVFPNLLDYWGPPGMVFLRVPQVRWTPITGDQTLAFAVEQPSEIIDVGTFDRVIQDMGLDIQGVERMPNLTSRYRHSGDWGYLQCAGILRTVGFESVGSPPPPGNEPKDQFLGWGVNLSSNLYFRDRDRLILQYVTGRASASYMTDGGVDLAPTQTFPDPANPDTVPLFGVVIYYDWYWNDSWSTSFGYSVNEVDNRAGQRDDAFRRGEYSSINLVCQPDDSLQYGIEYLWGKRTDKDGASGTDNRIQFSARFSF